MTILMKRRIALYQAIANEADYDDIVLAWEKFWEAQDEQGERVLNVINRAYESARLRGALGALTNRDGEFWRD